MSQRSRRGSWGVATLVVVLATGGCSGGSRGEAVSTPAPSPSATPTEPAPVTTRLAWGELAGGLPQATRQALALDVREVVDGWIDAAYIGGDYPRTDFSGSWPAFTARAQAQARHDGDLMSNRDIGASIDGVEAEVRDVALDVVSVRERPVGVTARVALRFSTTGDVPQTVRVHGRLFLTRGEQGWQVFGYDVTKDAQ